MTKRSQLMAAVTTAGPISSAAVWRGVDAWETARWVHTVVDQLVAIP